MTETFVCTLWTKSMLFVNDEVRNQRGRGLESLPALLRGPVTPRQSVL